MTLEIGFRAIFPDKQKDTLKEHDEICSKCKYGVEKNLRNYAYNPTYVCRLNVIRSYTCKRNNNLFFSNGKDFLEESEFKI